jgi:hypothetical protein
MALTLALAISCPAYAVTPQQVEETLQRAQRFLREQQKNGSWEEVPQPDPREPNSTRGGQWSGTTALATYALLASGESPQLPHMQAAIKLLEKSPVTGGYAVGVRAQVWGFLPPKPEYKAAMTRDANLLQNSMRTQGEARGMFWYLPGKGPEYDHSVSQYGVLGMWACAQMGYDTSRSFWADADNGWRRHQNKSGGWSYIAGAPAPWGQDTASMTAAGVATLIITQDYLHSADFAAMHGNVNDQAIEGGLKWMGEHFAQVFADGNNLLYSLYGVERIGVAAGRKYLGKHNWFDEGAAWLVQNQNADGSWGKGPPDMFAQNGKNVVTTSFGILFLVRGRAPVMMSKLTYDLTPAKGKPVPGLWNQRPRDVANLARWIGKEIERDLNWQSVTLEAPIEELLEAPILYIAGSQPLSFTDGDQAKLREYVQRGGLILGNADGGSVPFGQSFIKLGKELFPDYEFAEMPASHPVYVGEQFPREKWKNKPALQHLTNGVRELMLLFPTADPSRSWQSQSAAAMREDMFQLGDDIFLYTVARQSLQYKGDTYLVKPNDALKPVKTIKLARLKYPGNWNPEPAGWPRLAAIVHNENKINLVLETVELGKGQLAGKYRIAHLTGTTAWTMPAAALDDLRAFIKEGSTLIIDCAGGSTEFAGTVEASLAKLYPDAAHQLSTTLPPDHPLFKATTGQQTPIEWRRWTRKLLGNLRSHRLRTIEVDHRIAIFYSAEDLSAGLVGEAVDGITGYEPATAAALVSDMILFSTGNAYKAPATVPAK